MAASPIEGAGSRTSSGSSCSGWMRYVPERFTGVSPHAHEKPPKARRVPLNILQKFRCDTFSYPTVSNTLREKRLQIAHIAQVPWDLRELRRAPSSAVSLQNPSCGYCAIFGVECTTLRIAAYAEAEIHLGRPRFQENRNANASAALIGEESVTTSGCRDLRDRHGHRDHRGHVHRRHRGLRRIRRDLRRRHHARPADALH